MSTPALLDILTVLTQDQWTAIALAQLQGRDFPTTDYTSTSPERAMIETDTACLADQSEQIPLIVQLVLVYYALQTPNPDGSPGATAALQFLAYNWYEIDAFPATATIGTIRLTCAASAGPYTITAGQLIAVGAGGLLYTNTTGGTLAAGGTLDLLFQCQQVNAYATSNPEAAEVNGDVGNNTITRLQTPLPGVTINNPGSTYSAVTKNGSGTGTLTLTGAGVTGHAVTVLITATGQSGFATWSTSLDGAAYVDQGAVASITNLGGLGINIALTNGASAPSFVLGDTLTFVTPGTWVTTPGASPESQISLAGRCLARWPALGAVPNSDVYTNWAIESGTGQITRVLVETDPAVAATVNVYIAAASGPATAALVSEAQTYIDARCPLTDLPVVIAAGVTAITIDGVASYPAGRVGGYQDLDDAITSYVANVGIGGTIECAQIVALAMKLNAVGVSTGATNITGVDLGSGVGVDVTLGAHSVASTVTSAIVWTAVA